jgi:hypothetical protein
MKTFKQLLDERCWPGYKPVPGKKAYTPGSCVKEETQGDAGGADNPVFTKPKMMKVKKEEVEALEEKGPGLWANIRAKKARGERMRKPGEEGAPTEAQLKSARNEEYEQDDGALTEDQLEQMREAAAWERAEGKNPEGGLNRKGIESYRRENPGSKLSMAVTTKPSKLKPGSKAANRRKSFCARMGGMKKRLTSAKTARDPDSRINKALRKWNC